MATDKVTKEQRLSIYQNGKKAGTHEGFRFGVSHVSSYLSEYIGGVSLYALGAVLDANGNDETFGTHFNAVDWEELGATTLDDLTALTPEELAATYRDAEMGANFATAVKTALNVFNLKD